MKKEEYILVKKYIDYRGLYLVYHAKNLFQYFLFPFRTFQG